MTRKQICLVIMYRRQTNTTTNIFAIAFYIAIATAKQTGGQTALALQRMKMSTICLCCWQISCILAMFVECYVHVFVGCPLALPSQCAHTAFSPPTTTTSSQSNASRASSCSKNLSCCCLCSCTNFQYSCCSYYYLSHIFRAHCLFFEFISSFFMLLTYLRYIFEHICV